MNEERMTILNMIAQGTITPEEGEKLLRALDEGDNKKKSRSETGNGDFHEERERDNTWESGFERMMEGIGRKMEKLGEEFGFKSEEMEKMGEEMGRRAEMMAEDLATNLEGVFERFDNNFKADSGNFSSGKIQFKGIKKWGLEGGFEGEPVDFSSDHLNVNGAKGLILFSPMEERKGRSRDFNVCSNQGSEFLYDHNAVLDAVDKEGWILMAFKEECALSLPGDLIPLGIFTPNGDIDLSVSCPDINAETMNGDIRISLIKGDVCAKSFNGDIRADFHELFDGQCDLNTMNGNIECRIPSLVNLDFTAKTMKGDLNADGPGLKIKGQFNRPANNFITGTIGDGGESSVLLNTMKGDISLSTVE